MAASPAPVQRPGATSSAEMARLMCGHDIVPAGPAPASLRARCAALRRRLDRAMPARRCGAPASARGRRNRRHPRVSGNGQKGAGRIISGTLSPSEGSVACSQAGHHFSPNAMSAGFGRIPRTA